MSVYTYALSNDVHSYLIYLKGTGYYACTCSKIRARDHVRNRWCTGISASVCTHHVIRRMSVHYETHMNPLQMYRGAYELFREATMIRIA